jgi:lysophospholipase L1-like esterase
VRRIRILAFQGALVLALFEIGLRIYNPLPFRVRGERIILHVHQHHTFYQTQASKLDPIVYHTKNSLGFRGPDPPRDMARRLTLVTIGGSTTECLFLSDGKTWTDVLARRLASAWPDIWVNNAGLDGQSTYGHLILLRDFVVSLRPTVAVFLVGVNDLGLDSLNSYDGSLLPNRPSWRSAGIFLADHSEVAGLAQNLLRLSRARKAGFGHSEIDLTKLTVIEHNAEVSAATIRQYRSSLPGFGERLIAIAELCRQNGIDPVFVTQPALYGDGIDPATGINLATLQVRGAANGRLWWSVQEMYNDVTRGVARDRHLLLIDAARELPKDSRLFYDFIHFTNDGAARLGQIVASHLEPYLQHRPTRP